MDEAIELVWPENKTVLEPMVGKVMATLKSYVDGRDEDAWAECDEVAQQADVPFGFIYNLIESHFIDFHCDKTGADWYEGNSGGTIVIPSRFGVPRL